MASGQTNRQTSAESAGVTDSKQQEATEKPYSSKLSGWRENFYAIYLMVLINKLTFSQQSASIAQFDSKLSVGLTLGLYIIGKLFGNILFSRVVIRHQIKVALLCSTCTAILAAGSNLILFYMRDKLPSSIAEAVLQCIIQFLIGIGTGNKGAITTYISATVRREELARANLRISCYENVGYTLGPLTVVILTFVPDPTLISSLAHIALQVIIVIILLLMKTTNTKKVRDDKKHGGAQYALLCKVVLKYLPLSTCSCVFSLYVAVAVSVSKTLFGWDDITLIRYHAPTLLIASLLSTFIAYNLKAAMKNNNIRHIPTTSGMFLVMLSMVTLVPAMISIAEKEVIYHNGGNTTAVIKQSNSQQTIYYGLSHMWLITCGLALASFGNVICKVNYFSSTAQEVKGNPRHMGIIAAVWWFSSGLVTLLYGLIASMHFTVIVFPSVMTLTFVIIFVAYYTHWVVTCRRPFKPHKGEREAPASPSQIYPTISQLTYIHTNSTSSNMMCYMAIYPFYSGGFHDDSKL